MHPLAIVLIGVAIVIIGILAFRLHAFLALILAALTCALLTPQAALERFLVQQASLELIRSGDELRLSLGPQDGAQIGERYQVVRSGVKVTRDCSLPLETATNCFNSSCATVLTLPSCPTRTT